MLLLLYTNLSAWAKPPEGKKNQVHVHSISMQNYQEGRICFEIVIENPNCDVTLDLDNVTDLDKVRQTLCWKNQDSLNKAIVYSIHGKQLRLSPQKNKLQNGNKFYLSYVDTTLTHTFPEYQIQFQKSKDSLSATLCRQLTITNRTNYLWNKGVQLKIQLSDQNCEEQLILQTPVAVHETTKLCLKGPELCLKNHLQYRVDITDFSNVKPLLPPRIFLDMSQAWPSINCFQVPGPVRIQFCQTGWEKVYGVSEFETLIKNTDLPLFQYRDALLQRVSLNTVLRSLKSKAKEKIVTLFSKTDFIYNNESSYITITLIHDKKKTDVPPKSSVMFQEKAPLAVLSLLINPQTVTGDVASQFKKLASQLESLRKKQLPVVPFSARLQYLYDTALKYTELLNEIPSEEAYQKKLQELASTGDHDADVTLLRKQRTEQAKQVKSFIRIYNALVLGSAEVYPIKIEVPAGNFITGSPTGLGPGVRATYLPIAAAPKPPPAPKEK